MQAHEFWRRVAPPDEDGCRIYMGTKDSDGYGAVKSGGKMFKAHRLAFLFSHGSIDDALQVQHTCNNRPCCEPIHLIQGTPKQNSEWMVKSGRAVNNVGEKNPRRKLTEAQAVALKGEVRAGGRPTVIARNYGVTYCHLRGIMRGEIWRDLL